MLKKVDNRHVVSFLNHSVNNAVGLRPMEGKLFGVELEVEGRNVGMDGVPTKGWKRVAEGSLRGESTEYVFNKPVDYEASIGLVDNLFSLFRKNGVELKNSHRTSTHVHLNFMDKPVKNVITFFLAHTILEEVLASYCGETRRGNLFCISSRHNEELVDTLNKCVFQFQNLHEFGEGVRYCAANLAALNKFGTIEIRTMRGADNKEMVKDWLHILNQLYEYSCRENNPAPARLVESLSHLGPDRFLRQFFDDASIIKLMASWKGDLHQSLMEGVRLVQMFAYRLDEVWDVPFKVAKLEPAPDWGMGAPAPGGVRHDDNPRVGFNRAARDNARGIVAQTAFYAPHINAGLWWIGGRVGERTNINGRMATFNDRFNCFIYDDTGMPLRYIVHGGRELIYGSNREYDVNRGYYNFFGVDPRVEAEPEEDDEDFDVDMDFDEGDE